MNRLSIAGLEVKNKLVFLRVDFNVPLKDGVITDDTRIRAALPSINHLLKSGAKLVVASHLGKPKGKINPDYSLKPVFQALKSLVDYPVDFVADCVGAEVEQKKQQLQPGALLLLENLRFHAGEESGGEEFCHQLSEGIEVYVNDAFGTSHRAHASMFGLPKVVGLAAAGFLVEKELKYLAGVVRLPQRPFLAIIGGAKVSSKIGVLESLLYNTDMLIIGGAMAFTFELAAGKSIGSSLVESDKQDVARSIVARAQELNKELVFPLDYLVLTEDQQVVVKRSGELSAADKGMDVGPETVKLFSQKIASAKTVVWNGPLGVFEDERFNQGTFGIAKLLAETNENVVTVVGGGDSVATINSLGLAADFTHISTGGGASLELLEGKELPGIQALTILGKE